MSIDLDVARTTDVQLRLLEQRVKNPFLDSTYFKFYCHNL